MWFKTWRQVPKRSRLEIDLYKQMQALCFLDFGGKVITGKVSEVCDQLTKLVEDAELGIPEYVTQDEVYDDPSKEDISDTVNIQVDLKFHELTVGEVYCRGDDCWYKGIILDVDLDDNIQSRIHYRQSGVMTQGLGVQR